MQWNIRKRQDNFIKSYGIILFCENNKESETKFLILQRRDTYGYSNFILGLWTEDNIYDLIELMTKEEKERIRNNSFDDLWEDFWVLKYINSYGKGKERAREKFVIFDKELLKENDNVTENILFKEVKNSNEGPPWGFPKGRQEEHETIYDCALREFEEETLINCKNIKKWSGVGPYVETYIGQNNKNYQYNYFIASCEEMPKIEYIDIQNNLSIRKKTISSETSDYKWVTLSESELYLTPKAVNILKELTKDLCLN